MSRHRFALEGVETPLKRTIEVDAIKILDDEIPVVWNADLSDLDKLMGAATDFQREDDGWISAEIDWNPDYQSLIDHDLAKSFFLTIWANEVESRKTGGLEIVTSCRLRMIYATVGKSPWVTDG